MDEKKADCVAVPTTDATPSPPPYGDEACQHGNKCCKKRSLLNFPLARSYPKVFWFGVSAAALFLLSRIPSFHVIIRFLFLSLTKILVTYLVSSLT